MESFLGSDNYTNKSQQDFKWCQLYVVHSEYFKNQSLLYKGELIFKYSQVCYKCTYEDWLSMSSDESQPAHFETSETKFKMVSHLNWSSQF